MTFQPAARYNDPVAHLPSFEQRIDAAGREVEFGHDRAGDLTALYEWFVRLPAGALDAGRMCAKKAG